MNRRTFVATLPALAAARSVLAAAGAARARIGLCTFSCHQHWKAVAAKQSGVKFTDTESFYRYARELGAEGVQTPLRSQDPAVARRIRDLVERDGSYYEGELRLPKTEGDLAAFEADVRLTREAGAGVARAVFTGGRRYEIFKTLEEFTRFHAGARHSLTLAEPVLRRHRLKLAIENHKDHTIEELARVMREFQSEWIGVLVDTGNNLALLDEPHAVIETLAPFALSVHLKDMAVQPHADGFLLSEVPLGSGLLDLPRVISTLRRANPGIVFNLEMATRDPLNVPCRTDVFWATFPERRATHLAAALDRVKSNPPRQPPPQVTGKSVAAVLAEEEANNRHDLDWMHGHIRT
ncbi:MAG: sugar phosphate isomerase/epimerase [Opitutus sp.]|nr:sugar phosphate isomerase/epimerase [Opitutus sp.]